MVLKCTYRPLYDFPVYCWAFFIVFLDDYSQNVPYYNCCVKWAILFLNLPEKLIFLLH